MKIRILISALADLQAGRDFYENQDRGLGTYFLESLFSDIDSLARHAGVHRKVFGFHRLLSERFPWAIYYRFDADGSVLVFRVLDCRQHPRKTRMSLRRVG